MIIFVEQSEKKNEREKNNIKKCAMLIWIAWLISDATESERNIWWKKNTDSPNDATNENENPEPISFDVTKAKI